MSHILETLQTYTSEAPDAPILFDESHAKGVTYAQLDDMSGRVYGWLKSSQIGKEDFVLINLPRGVLPVVAMVGVWKAGAAWALVEDTYAPERIAYIRGDVGCKAEINAENWGDIMRAEPLPGFEPADDHDAAYAIYTSGTTGNPKGVLHERGNLERAIMSISYDGRIPFNEGERLATLSPLNFVATVIVILCCLNTFKAQNHILSYATVKNTMALAKHFLSRRITVTFLTPSYVRMLGNRRTPELRMLFVGSEPANNVYVDGVELVNIYASSETGFAVGLFKIDKSYDTCPIGRPQVATKVVLLGEDGREVADGEIGELCCENPYVRGYINLPEETEKAFADGMYRTGDLARKEPDGNYVILGRNTDMIKINGNRIEPAEIEAAVKQALNIDWAAAKGFEENGRSYLCAYYTADVQVDPAYMQQELSKRLPAYMIPAYYIKIDSVPMKANGKLDRKALPAPKVERVAAEYAAPTNETEEKLCAAMAGVLKRDRVGIHDDFYELGGDSLASIQLVTDCGLPGLSANEVFRGRTPERIAALYAELRAGDDGVSVDEKNDASMQKVHPLTAEQMYMIDYQLYTPGSTMYNLFTVLKVDKTLVDPRRVAETMGRAIQNHPALLTAFFYDDDGKLMQRYTPENFEEIHVEKLSEFEFKFLKDMLVYPFKIIGGRLYRCRVFETEKHCYVFFDVHHSVFDGTSMKVFIGNALKALTGMEMDKDYYYLMLQRREEDVHSALYEESKAYFESRFEGVEWSSHPKIDHKSRENETGELTMPLGIQREQLEPVEKMYGVSRNEFFITVAALAIAIYNKKTDIRLSWIYNGREDPQMMSTVGLLFRDLPIGIRLRDHLTLRSVFEDVREQVRGGIEHCRYPYVELHDQVVSDDSAYLLYQQDIRDMGGLEGAGAEILDVRQNQAASQTILDIQILDGEDGLILMIDFAASRYRELSMHIFKDIYVLIAHNLVRHGEWADVNFRDFKAMLADPRNVVKGIKAIVSQKR